MLIGEEARRLALVSALYAALTFVMAYPFSAAPGSTVLADAPDTHLYIWTLAWDTHAFLTQPFTIFDANIYAPYANTLAYSENLIGSALFAAPIIWLTGNPVLAMNLVALLTCVLCGVGAYVMARQWRLSPPAAFVCGVVFAFAPPRFFRMGQLHMTAVQWIPFTLAFVQAYFDRSQRRHLLLAIGGFSLQALSSGHGAAFLAIAIVLLTVWRVAFGQPLAVRTWLKGVGVAGAYLLAPAVWVMLPYRLAQSEAGLRREYPADAMPRLESFLASPARLHVQLQEWWLGRTVNDEAVAFLFPGVLVVALATIAVVCWRPRSRNDWRRDATGFFLVLAMLSGLMFVQWPVDLWRQVHWLPGFNFIRVPSRFILMVMLCLGMLAAAAVDCLTTRASRTSVAIAALVSVLLLLEYASYPFASVPFTMNVPAIDRWLDRQPKPFVVAEVPVPSPGNLGRYERHHTTAMLHSTAHWQKTVHGYSGIRRRFHDTLYLELTAFPSARSLSMLREAGATHVVVHTDLYPPERWQQVEAQLREEPGLSLLHTEGEGRVYALLDR